MILGERHCDNKSLIEAALQLLTYFIDNVDHNFLQLQLPSLFFLLLPLIKHTSATIDLFEHLLYDFQYSLDTYLKLYFLPYTDTPRLAAIRTHIDNEIGKSTAQAAKKVALTRSKTANELYASIVASASSVPGEAGDDHPGAPTTLTPNELIIYVQSDHFAIKCQEIVSILDHVQASEDGKLRQVALQQLYSILDYNKHFWYYLCSTTNMGHLRNVQINLFTNAINEYDSGAIVASQNNDSSSSSSSSSTTSATTFFDFTRFIVQSLLECIKCSTSLSPSGDPCRVQTIATNCLGLFGAGLFHSPNDSTLPLPFQMDYFKMIERYRDSNGSTVTSVDYANRTMFHHKKKLFKLTLLRILAQIIKQTSNLRHFTNAELAIYEVMEPFSNVTNCSLFWEANDDGEHHDLATIGATADTSRINKSREQFRRALEKHVDSLKQLHQDRAGVVIEETPTGRQFLKFS